jgi:hypothetical protein
MCYPQMYFLLDKYNKKILFLLCFDLSRSRGSSGSIACDYGLDDRAIEVRSPTGAEDFSSSPCVQTGSGAHPASCPMGTRRGRGVTLTTHPHLVAEVKYE